MFNHSLHGVTYSDGSTSSSSSSPNSFSQTQSPRHPTTAAGHAASMHRAPEVPSTFLPSYYPEGRYSSMDQELRGGAGMASALREELTGSHSPATWEKMSQAGPSNRHLLDGISISEPQPRPSRVHGPPTYSLTPGSIASSIVPPTNRVASYPIDPSLHSMSSTPNTHGTGTASPAGGGGGGGGGGGAARYHPYSRERDMYGSIPMSSASSSTSRNNTYSNTTMPEPMPGSTSYPGNMYGNVPLPERPEDAWDRTDGEITSEDYAQVGLPCIPLHGYLRVGPDALLIATQALEIYSHMLEAVPSMRLQHESLPPGGQRYDNLINMASDGLSILTGRSGAMGVQYPPADINNPPGPSSLMTNGQKRAGPGGSTGAGGADKKVTKCLGCGATETPEWRRGPLGPRTLCNACVRLAPTSWASRKDY